MASVLDRYGIKEVADFTFYQIGDDGKPTNPVLYLDTLKVSTIEQTADVVDAKGGKGNATLLSWDTNKEINVTLEDALFSAKSLAVMFGNGKVKDYGGASANEANIMKTETFTASKASTKTTTLAEAAGEVGWDAAYNGPNGNRYKKDNPRFYKDNGEEISGTTVVAGAFAKDSTYFCTYDLIVPLGKGNIIDMGADQFPGTYYCVGDTYARNEKTGKDEFFQFIIPKAKVQASNTLELSAEGDPSTFSMSLKVLKPSDGIMMKLVKYDATLDTSEVTDTTRKVLHNHDLATTNAAG